MPLGNATTKLERITRGFYCGHQSGYGFTVRQTGKVWESYSLELGIDCRYPTRRQAEVTIREYCKEAADVNMGE
jgi:hypothetical protein